MIGKIRYEDGRIYICDDCKQVVMKFKNENLAKKAGWAVAYARKKCYCPTCAPDHRNTGRGGAPLPLPEGWVQPSFLDKKIKEG